MDVGNILEKMFSFSSSSELQASCDQLNLPISILRFEDLKYFPSIHDIVNPNNPNTIIFYQWGHDDNSNYGHWTALKLLPNGEIAHFDSVGDHFINILKNIPYKYRKLTGQTNDTLKKLIANDSLNDFYHYSDTQLQSYDDDIATCGRWVILFLLSDLDPDAFANKIFDIINNNPDMFEGFPIDLDEYGPDLFATIATRDLL